MWAETSTSTALSFCGVASSFSFFSFSNCSIFSFFSRSSCSFCSNSFLIFSNSPLDAALFWQLADKIATGAKPTVANGNK
ncbi:hypothetical protein [Mycoplasmopsis arginini]|uniref:hypothetical protein n=1 Tax=Mycoplasmopsis arginini TaxID=2094 RepID=UPI00227B3689|nr:hypothetical protein [Mycoplasmopsis arginini]